MNKMFPKIKALWLKALRSGKYKKCQEVLRETEWETGELTGAYCLLGVLTDVYVKKERKGKDYKPLWDSGTLHKRVMKWAGLKENNPQINDHGAATEINDESKRSFKQMAKLVEKYL